MFENISGDCLQIRDVDNVVIENCIFRNISGNGIKFRSSGSSNNVKILNNEIYSIGDNCMIAPENQYKYSDTK